MTAASRVLLAALAAACWLVGFACGGARNVPPPPPQQAAVAPEALPVPVLTIHPPDKTVDFSLTAEFVAPRPARARRFEAGSGLASMTRDDVTVEVDVISSAIKECCPIVVDNPDIGNGVFEYNFFPLVLVFRITNGTEHVLTLRDTVVELKDEHGVAFPLVASLADQKKLLVAKVFQPFDYTAMMLQLNGWSQFRKAFATSYTPKYEELLVALADAKGKGARMRTSDMKEGSYLSDAELEALKVNYSPNSVYNEYDKHVKALLSEKTNHVRGLQRAAYRAVEDGMPLDMYGMVTGGVYAPIQVPPGKTVKVLVPFNDRQEDEIIARIAVRVREVPTRVDAAGVPTKRASYDFEMFAVK